MGVPRRTVPKLLRSKQERSSTCSGALSGSVVASQLPAQRCPLFVAHEPVVGDDGLLAFGLNVRRMMAAPASRTSIGRAQSSRCSSVAWPDPARHVRPMGFGGVQRFVAILGFGDDAEPAPFRRGW